MINIIEQLDKIKENAKELGIELTIYPKHFDPERLNVLWFEGDIASFKYDDYTIIISAAGEIDASYFEKDKLIYNPHKTHCLPSELEQYLTDKDLQDDLTTRYSYADKKIAEHQDKTLFIEANNWLEFNVFNNKTNNYWGLILCNIIEDDSNVLDSLNNLQYYIDFIKENKKDYDLEEV